MKAIETKYLGPTNYSGSRIKATDNDGNSVTMPYDYELNSYENYRLAAIELCRKMNWKGNISGGYTKKGMVWVFVRDIYAIV